ncbi:hypothetical protein RMATCC62417_07092 [Rhizopus microsporus]|nr:hypothetical protein RMATCC62417_07092 [Rhizopus microsporus]
MAPMVETNKSRTTTLKKLAKWTPSSNSSFNKKGIASPLSPDAPFVPVHYDQLQQGSLYIIKIKQVSLALFEGWNDDMCCFSILRSEVEPMRWSEARQLPGDFDIYDAFDECGNPPIHLWSRYLKTNVPSNWFYMFEEARLKQRAWFREHDEYVRQTTTTEQGRDVHSSLSNTDVSTMLLSPQESIVSSAVASTNIVDPGILHEDTSFTPTSPAFADGESVTRQTSTPSSLVIDREQIRRHLAPGQASVLNRQSSVVVGLPSINSTISQTSSKRDVESTTVAEESRVDRLDLQEYSAQLDFPHDSDQFSIRSDLPGSSSPSLSILPSKSRSRPSMKKIIWN